MIRALPARFETNAGTAAAFTDLALHGLPDDWYAQFAGAVRKVTAADVKAVAKALLPSGTLAIAIVGDVGKIRPELDKLGLGAPTAYDLHAMPVAASAPRPACPNPVPGHPKPVSAPQAGTFAYRSARYAA